MRVLFLAPTTEHLHMMGKSPHTKRKLDGSIGRVLGQTCIKVTLNTSDGTVGLPRPGFRGFGHTLSLRPLSTKPCTVLAAVKALVHILGCTNATKVNPLLTAYGLKLLVGTFTRVICWRNELGAGQQ